MKYHANVVSFDGDSPLPDRVPRTYSTERLELELSGGGTSRGGDILEDRISTQAYIDRSMDAVRAQNDARFGEVLSEIKGLGTRLDHIEKGQISPWQVWAAALTGFGAVLAVLAFAGDQFGLGSNLADQRFEQLQLDQSQNERIESILSRLDALLAAQATQTGP